MSDENQGNAGWAAKGWGEVDDELKKPSGGGDFQARDFATDVGTTRRFVILDDEPFAFHEHSTYGIPNAPPWTNPICLRKNGALSEMYGDCPFCESGDLHKETKGVKGRELYASFIGRITVIDCGVLTIGPTGQTLTGWKNNDGKEYNFDRKLLALKRGGKDKPGLLQRFRERRVKKGGSLVGWVVDTQRMGTKEERPGTEWEFICKIDVSTVEKLRAGLLSLEGIRPDVHGPLIAAVKATGALDYASIFKPMSRKDMQAILTGAYQKPGSAPAEGGSAFDKPSNQTSMGYTPPEAPALDPEDDSIPF